MTDSHFAGLYSWLFLCSVAIVLTAASLIVISRDLRRRMRRVEGWDEESIRANEQAVQDYLQRRDESQAVAAARQCRRRNPERVTALLKEFGYYDGT
ncbi:MAG: hypothetical protein ACYTGL_13970 [Planctomycetota bacterium]